MSRIVTRLHVGPYLTFQQTPRVVQRRMFGCVNVKCVHCNRHSDSVYCSSCGDKQVEHFIPETDYDPDFRAFAASLAANGGRPEKFTDATPGRNLHGYLILLPTTSYVPGRPEPPRCFRSMTYRGSGEVLIFKGDPPETLTIASDLKWFRDAHARELEAIQFAHPTALAEVCWGVLMYTEE